MGGNVLSTTDVQRRNRRTADAAGAPRSRAGVLWPALTALLVCLLWTAVESTRVGVPAPFEDAAMLFKYAENLANGGGIAWNAGQAPGLTDGATDLGMVLALAPLTLLGLSTAMAAIVLNLLAVVGIGALFGVLNNRVWHRTVWLPVALAALVGGGPVDRYVLSGFSPPVMGFLLLAAFTLAALVPMARSDRGALVLVAAAGLTAGIGGWWRPEAFALGPLAVVFGVLLTWNAGGRRTLVLSACGAFLAPFAAMVLLWIGFRISYFGQLLPTSAVMKSGAVHVDNAVFSLEFYCSLLLPLLGVLISRALGERSARSWWIAAAVLIAPALWVNAALPQDFWNKIGIPFATDVCTVAAVVVLVPVLVALAGVGYRRRTRAWVLPAAIMTFSLVWTAIATTLNWWGRMQWPLLPVLVAIAATAVVAGRDAGAALIGDVDGTRRRTPNLVVALLAVVGLAPFHLPIGGYFESPFQTAVSEALTPVDTSNVRIATTEAGLIPLAVAGTALDTYGHNNRSIAATRGGSLDAELNAFRPNVIAMHGLPPDSVALERCTPEVRASQQKFSAGWSRMVDAIYGYAQRERLALVRISETSPCETWSLWLADDVDPQVRRALAQLTMPGTEVSVRSVQ